MGEGIEKNSAGIFRIKDLPKNLEDAKKILEENGASKERIEEILKYLKNIK